MNPSDKKIALNRSIRLERARERLGSNEPRCLHCGQDDPICLEAHHIAGRSYHDDTVIECRNCHRKLSDAQKDHPASKSSAPHPLEQIGRYLLGIADLFRLLIKRLDEFGRSLIELARADTTQTTGERP